MISKEGVRKILVYRIGQIGDTIIALPSIWALREYFPSAHICLLSNGSFEQNSVSAKNVLPAKGLFDEWLEYQSGPLGGSRSARFQLLSKIRGGGFDTLVYLAPRLRTTFQVYRDLTFFRLGGIRRFLAHKGFRPLPLPKQEGNLPAAEHEADHLLKRLSLSGLPVPPQGEGCMELGLTEEESDQANAWLTKHLGNQIGNRLLVGIAPGSNWPSKVWPEVKFAELGKRLVAQFGVFPIVVGGPDDRQLGVRLVGEWGTGAIAAGELSVRQTAAVLALCKFFVGNDTGGMHLAAAVGIRCIAIFSAQDWPGRWYPYGDGHIVLRHAVPCEGCLLSVCVEEGMRCLRLIEIDEVVAACRKTIGG